MERHFRGQWLLRSFVLLVRCSVLDPAVLYRFWTGVGDYGAIGVQLDNGK